jgi:hypothetical protein
VLVYCGGSGRFWGPSDHPRQVMPKVDEKSLEPFDPEAGTVCKERRQNSSWKISIKYQSNQEKEQGMPEVQIVEAQIMSDSQHCRECRSFLCCACHVNKTRSSQRHLSGSRCSINLWTLKYSSIPVWIDRLSCLRGMVSNVPSVPVVGMRALRRTESFEELTKEWENKFESLELL